MQGTTVLKWDNLRGASVSIFVFAGSLYIGNELEKYCIYAFIPFELAVLA